MPVPQPDAMGLELAEQLEVWTRLWRRRDELARLARAAARSGTRRVFLAGCGDCHAAAEFGAALVSLRTRFGARSFPAMELSRSEPHLLDPETLVVAVSVSGRTPRVLEVARAARKAGASVLAVTDDPGSPLAEEAPHTLILGTAPEQELHRTDYKDPEAARYIGYQRPVAGTKTYGAAALALAMLALAWEEIAPSGRGSPRALFEGRLAELPTLAPASERAAVAAAARWREVPPRTHVTFCGTGLGFSAARFCAYKLLELACPASVSELEEYCHTYYLTTEAGSPVAFLAHDALTLERAREIAPVLSGDLGAGALTLGPGAEAAPSECEFALPAVPPEVAPLLLAYAGAHLVRALTRAWGLDTNRFRAGLDEERYVRGSTRIIRESRILA